MTTFTNNFIDLEYPIPIYQGGSRADNIPVGRDNLAFGSANSKNFIHGGNFDTNPWQRGLTFIDILSMGSFAGQGTVTADRFFLFPFQTDGSPKWTVLKDTSDAPSFDDCGLNVQSCLKVFQSAGSVSANADTVVQICQGMECALGNFLTGTWTLSFWVKASVPGTYSVSAGTIDFWAHVNIQTYTINNANTWEYKTITFGNAPVPAYLASFDTGLSQAAFPVIAWNLNCGSNWYATPNIGWQQNGGSYLYGAAGVSGQANPFPDNTSSFKLALVQAEIGPVATSFSYRSAAEELKICERYYEKSYAQGTYAGTTTTVNCQYMVPATKNFAGNHYMADYIYLKQPKASYPLFSSKGAFSLYSAVTGAIGNGSFVATGSGTFSDFPIFTGNTIDGNDIFTDKIQIYLPYSSDVYFFIVNGAGFFHYIAECEPGIQYQ